MSQRVVISESRKLKIPTLKSRTRGCVYCESYKCQVGRIELRMQRVLNRELRVKSRELKVEHRKIAGWSLLGRRIDGTLFTHLTSAQNEKDALSVSTTPE